MRRLFDQHWCAWQIPQQASHVTNAIVALMHLMALSNSTGSWSPACSLGLRQGCKHCRQLLQHCSWSSTVLSLLLLVLLGQLQQIAAMSAGYAPHRLQPQVMQRSVPSYYCPGGKSLEAGLCYKRCQPGYKPFACSCFSGLKSYSRGCGIKPQVCQAMSYRRQRLPAVTSRETFSLVISADPQLFRVVDDYKDVQLATRYSTQLVRSINNVTSLQQWTWESGGGAVQQPRALVVLGDMTEFYREDEVDAFRHYYDLSMPGGGQQGLPGEAQVPLPTWLMFGNHDYVNNVGQCKGQFKGLDHNACATTAVDTMRSVLTPGCDDTTWANFPRGNVTSFDAGSMAYSFDYNDWHFVVLQYSPSYIESSLSVRSSMSWLAAELSAATAQQRRIVLFLHAHRELGLALDPTFSRLVTNSNVVAMFYGHVHIKPWGMTGNYPNTNVPMFNCGASWYHVFCFAEFGSDRFRVAAVVHNASVGSSDPQWFGSSVHTLLMQQKAKPVLRHFTRNPEHTVHSRAVGAAGQLWPWLTVLAGLALLVMG